jgi:hypothetical protein
VKLGTVFEASHVGLHLWLQAICLLAAPSGKTTIRDLEVILGVSRRTAWLLKRRISGLIAEERAPILARLEVAAAVTPDAAPAFEAEASVSPRQVAGWPEGRLPGAPQLPFDLLPEQNEPTKKRPNRRPKRTSDPVARQLELPRE